MQTVLQRAQTIAGDNEGYHSMWGRVEARGVTTMQCSSVEAQRKDGGEGLTGAVRSVL